MINKDDNGMHKVILYRTETCIWCHKTEEFFNKHGIKFENAYVDRDKKVAEEMIRKSGQMAVPVIDIDGQIIVGYDAEHLKSLLNLA